MPKFIDLKVGESVSIDQGRIKINLHEKSGQRARLEVDADKSIKIEHVKHKRTDNVVAQGIKPAFAGS